MSALLGGLGHALSLAFAMFWEILWALILGFVLSGAVQAVVSKREMSRLLPDDSPRSLAIATGLGAASSSCSYAAVALARSIFRKGANFTAAMAFQFASTNLVIELGIIMAVLLGWQFTLAEFLGGPLMIVFLALLFRASLRPRMVEAARRNADRGLAGRMESHADMDMAVTQGSIWSRLRSPEGFTVTSHYFVMDWASVWVDIAIGLLLAGALGAWVPEAFWQGFFLVDHPLVATLWGPLVGPLVAVVSFVYSIGNVPLAAVLWNGGISFGGDLVHLRRPDRAADPGHLPPLLRLQDGRLPAGHLLRRHGRRRPAGRVAVRRRRARAAAAGGQSGGGQRHLELLHHPQPGLPGPGGGAGGAVPTHRRPGHAEEDGRPTNPRRVRRIEGGKGL
jgi:uncharacterized membrane protein YraQ (UPF0718 family)